MGVKINHSFSVASASEEDLFHFYSVVSDRSVLLILLILNLSLFYLRREVKVVRFVTGFVFLGRASNPMCTLVDRLRQLHEQWDK